MILSIDIGNTNMEFACFDEQGEIAFESRIQTDPYRMADEYAITLLDLFNLYRNDITNVKGAIISSVVPTATEQLKKAIRMITGQEALVVSPGIKTGLDIKIDDPSTLGGDLAAVSVGAKKHYPLPVIIVDLGTATKILLVDKKGCYRGGVIAPGVKISMQALADRTACLPTIGINNDPIRHVIGTNTIDSMRSGLLCGTACMIDGMIEKFEEELGENCTVVATGGFSSVIKPLCKKEFILDRDLVHKGLYEMYCKNVKAD